MKKLLFTILSFTMLVSTVSANEIIFSGGPEGGVFRLFSSAISEYLNTNQEESQFKNVPSRGSVENLKILEERRADFAIIY